MTEHSAFSEVLAGVSKFTGKTIAHGAIGTDQSEDPAGDMRDYAFPILLKQNSQFCFRPATCVALACGELRTRQGDIERVSVEYSVQPRGLNPSANTQPSPKKSR